MLWCLRAMHTVSATLEMEMMMIANPDMHILLRAPDDDSAVREALNALSEEGFIEADLDQIGVLEEEPTEEPHASAYQGALEGEVAIIRFDS
jgi:hypothetical protein